MDTSVLTNEDEESYCINKEKPVPNVSEYLRLWAVVLDQFTGSWLWRGQNRPWEPSPRIARLFPGGEHIKPERNLISEFKRRSRLYTEIQPRNEWEWLALAQHYRLPTRLLDWTDNILVALWFAIKECPDNGNPVVLGFSPEREDIIVSSDCKTKPLRCDRTLVFKPPHISLRVHAQGSWFTCHKYSEKKKRFSRFHKVSNIKDRFKYIRISADPNNLLKMMKRIDLCGINNATMFPSMDGLCSYLEWRETV